MKIKDKKPNFSKLIKFGFKNNKKDYCFEKPILDGEFIIYVTVTKNGEMTVKTIEASSKEQYTLHLIEQAKGSFVGKIREEYEKTISDIVSFCFVPDVFKEHLTLEVIKYAKEKYNSEPEYLWEKTPRNAVLRRSDTKKWYAAILTVKKSKIGLSGNEIAEVINIRAKEDDVKSLLNKKNFYPAYHMNKKHWLTVVLDSTVQLKDICKLIDTSYKLALK